MIQNTAERDVETGGDVGKKIKYTVQVTAKLFKMLSAPYSNKIRAVVRELSTNAYDSHVAAKKADTPFEVHLPNALEPWFSVKDYGVGMDADTIENVLTKYGVSTKEKTNDEVGCLGLGAKAPLCYTDQFTMTAIKDGKKINAITYLDKDGEPYLNSMESIDTDEPDGVTVVVLAQTKDFSVFAQEADELYRYFKTKPIITGAKIAMKEQDYLFVDSVDGFSYKVCKADNYVNNTRIVMGGIPYPIDMNAVYAGFSGSYTPEQYLVRQGVIITVPIGTVDVAIDREKLDYVPKTVKALQTILSKVAKSVVNNYQTTVACKSKYEARNLIKQAKHGNFYYIGVSASSIKYNGKSLDANITLPKGIDGHMLRTRSWASTDFVEHKVNSIDALDTLKIYVFDRADDKESMNVLNHYSKTNSLTAGYNTYTLRGDKKVIDDFLSEEGLDHTVSYTSTLPDIPPPPVAAPKVRSKPSTAAKAKLLEFGSTYNNTTYSNWTDIKTGNYPTNGVYVVIDRYIARIKDKDGKEHKLTNTDIINCFSRLKDLKLTVPKLYGVKPSKEEDLIKDKGKWINIRDFVENEMKTLTTRFSSSFVMDKIYEHMLSLSLPTTLSDKWDKFKKGSAGYELYETIKKYGGSYTTANNSTAYTVNRANITNKGVTNFMSEIEMRNASRLMSDLRLDSVTGATVDKAILTKIDNIKTKWFTDYPEVKKLCDYSYSVFLWAMTNDIILNMMHGADLIKDKNARATIKRPKSSSSNAVITVNYPVKA